MNMKGMPLSIVAFSVIASFISMFVFRDGNLMLGTKIVVAGGLLVFNLLLSVFEAEFYKEEEKREW